MSDDSGLTKPELISLINDYIGVNEGYLGDFTYRTHAEFYPQYCEVDIDPEKYRPGTTRQIFIRILDEADARTQAKIVLGVLAKYPPSSFPEAERGKKIALYERFRTVALRLQHGGAIAQDNLALQTGTVSRAIKDADTLLREHGATSGVDRIHTAMHGYLRAVCRDAGLAFAESDGINRLFRILRTEHPRFTTSTTRSDEITRILGSLGSVLDAMNPIRNQASLAHPNEELLPPQEAALVIDAARTILNYINRKLAAVR